jgi:hypothetical protein
MYDCAPDEYATAWTAPLWPVSFAMGVVGKAGMMTEESQGWMFKAFCEGLKKASNGLTLSNARGMVVEK